MKDFLNENLSKENNITSGQVYLSVIEKERRGEYLGSTVQIIPHLTDEIKNRIWNVGIRNNRNFGIIGQSIHYSVCYKILIVLKYIFITGGVLSSLGKGIISSSLGFLLKRIGLIVSIIKCDPYLNVDAGTMNPFQHGEVFVTEDGGETDLDIEHQ